MSEQMEMERRTAVFATTVLETTNDLVRFVYRSQVSDEQRTAAPRDAIEGRKGINLPDGTTLYVLKDTSIGNQSYRVDIAFSGDREPVSPTEPMHIEIVDMVEQGAAIENIREYVKQEKEGGNEMKQEEEEMDLDAYLDSLPTMDERTEEEQVTTDKVEQALLDDEPQEEEDWDDTVPNFSVSEEQVNETMGDAEVVIETPKPNLKETAWDGALLSGGRDDDSVIWRFDPRMAPCFVLVNEDAVNRGEAAPEFARVNNKKGEAALYALLNPTLADEKRPAGASLASAGVSSKYGLLAHPDWVDPILRATAEVDGAQAKVTSWKEGAKCRVDLDVSQATQSRKEAATRRKEAGASFLSLDAFGEMNQMLDGMYKFGFAIENSIDGKGAFHAAAMALRVYCGNLASMGGIQALWSARHTKNVIASINYDEFASNIVDATMELENWLIKTEMLSWLPMDVQLMSRLMSTAESHGLLTLPRVKWEEKGGEPKVSGGHLWRVIGDGFVNNERPHVAVSSGDKNTYYHALNAFTGAFTHKPEWTSKDGKTVMKGNVIGIDALSKKLQRTNDIFMSAATSGLVAAKKKCGTGENGTLTMNDKDDVKSYIAAHPEVIFVPHVTKDSRNKNRSSLKSIVEVPTIEEALNLVG